MCAQTDEKLCGTFMFLSRLSSGCIRVSDAIEGTKFLRCTEYVCRSMVSDRPYHIRTGFLYQIIHQIIFIRSGSHLSSRAVSSQVLSAASVLTIVFGMGTGVAPTRIATGIYINFCPQCRACPDSQASLSRSVHSLYADH